MGNLAKFIFYYTGNDEGNRPESEHTASGAIVHFTAKKSAPVIALTAGITPVQDLNGYDAPWVAGGFKNLLPNNANDETKSNNGITVKAENGVYTITGSATAGGGVSFALANSVDLSPSTNKIAFLNSSANGSISVEFVRESTTVHYWSMNTQNRVATGWTDSGNETVDTIKFTFPSTLSISGTFTVSPMLMITTETNPTSFSPYSNVCPITGWTGANVYRTGKNLYSREGSEYNVPVYAVDGTSASYPDVAVWWFKAKPSTSYTITIRQNTKLIYFRWINCDKDKGFINREPMKNQNDSPVTFTTTAQTEWVQVAINQYPTVQIDLNDWEIQIEEGSTATAYEPYSGTVYPVSWQTEAGTVFGGTVDVTTGVLTVTHRFAELTKNSNWSWNANNALAVCSVSGGIITNAVSQYDVWVSNNMFTNSSWAARNVGGVARCGMFYGASYIFVKSPNIESVDDLKAVLGDNTLQVVYYLATPVTYQLTPTEVQTLVGDNFIWADTGDVTVTYKGTPST